MKICIACSAGGHLTEALPIIDFLEKNKSNSIILFTFKLQGKEDKNHRIFYTINPKRDLLKFFKVISDSIKFLINEKPKVIISTGGGFVIPLCYLGKLFGSKIIFIETSSRITEKSLTGRSVYPIADLFFVQWKSLLKYYGKKAIYGGTLI
jgi:UDP-N-acetylglucosamine:LPS N-acetylglucosamine transferase